MATETSTLLSTQNADNIAITGGNMSGVTVSACTINNSSIGPVTGASGTLTLNTTTAVTVSSAQILQTSVIVMSPNVVAVRTTTAAPTVTSIAAGQFAVTGAASDSSVMNWAIIRTV